MKKINILIIFIAIFFFTYGFGSHKFQIFPYKTIVELKNLIKNLINKDENKFKLDDENFNKIIKEQNKVRDEYPQWSDKIRLIKYYPGLNIFSDRNYYNHFNDNLFNINFYEQNEYKKGITCSRIDQTKIYLARRRSHRSSRADRWLRTVGALLLRGRSRRPNSPVAGAPRCPKVPQGAPRCP